MFESELREEQKMLRELQHNVRTVISTYERNLQKINKNFSKVDGVAEKEIESYIKKLGDLSLNIANNYLSFLEGLGSNISLDSFVYSITDVNKLVNLVSQANVSENEKVKILDACKILDGISYGMITKYLKQCSLYNENIIRDLNVILDDSSIRLNGKPYRKDLKHDKSKQYVDRTNVCVKLATAQSQKKKRNLLIALGIVGIAILAVILTVICINLK